MFLVTEQKTYLLAKKSVIHFYIFFGRTMNLMIMFPECVRFFEYFITDATLDRRPLVVCTCVVIPGIGLVCEIFSTCQANIELIYLLVPFLVLIYT